LPRLIVPLLTVALGAGMLILYVFVSTHPAGPPPAPPKPKPAIVSPQPGASAFSWRLLGATSAERMLVLEVETARAAEAVAIAQQLTEPYKDRYDEVLVLIFEPGDEPRLPRRRVQWTRKGGYRTLELREE
jgi:hypothetical protein